MKPLTINETAKAQHVRLADVYFIGPLMIWGGARAIPTNPVPGILLTLFGMGTIIYNGVNYRMIKRRMGEP
jgi:hypothetical protein